MSIMKWFSHLVAYRVASPPAEKGVAKAAGAPEEKTEVGNVASLVSTDSLVTFGGGTFGITVIWGVFELLTGWPHNLWVGVVISAIFGICLFGGDTQQKSKPPSAPLRLRILAAVVNTCVIFGAANTAMMAKNSVSPNLPAPAASELK
jgi:hypothetical protein